MERNLGGRILGALVFLAGVALLVLTFMQANDLFRNDPSQLFRPEAGKTIDINQAGANFGGVIVRVLVLIVMAMIAGMIANRGVKMYADAAKSIPPAPKSSDA